MVDLPPKRPVKTTRVDINRLIQRKLKEGDLEGAMRAFDRKGLVGNIDKPTLISAPYLPSWHPLRQPLLDLKALTALRLGMARSHGGKVIYGKETPWVTYSPLGGHTRSFVTKQGIPATFASRSLIKPANADLPSYGGGGTSVRQMRNLDIDAMDLPDDIKGLLSRTRPWAQGREGVTPLSEARNIRAISQTDPYVPVARLSKEDFIRSRTKLLRERHEEAKSKMRDGLKESAEVRKRRLEEEMDQAARELKKYEAGSASWRGANEKYHQAREKLEGHGDWFKEKKREVALALDADFEEQMNDLREIKGSHVVVEGDPNRANQAKARRLAARMSIGTSEHSKHYDTLTLDETKLFAEAAARKTIYSHPKGHFAPGKAGRYREWLPPMNEKLVMRHAILDTLENAAQKGHINLENVGYDRLKRMYLFMRKADPAGRFEFLEKFRRLRGMPGLFLGIGSMLIPMLASLGERDDVA